MRAPTRLAVAAAFLATALAAPTANAADYAQTARAVLAPGQAGGVPATANSTDQIPLYDGLTPLFFNVSAADINRLYKPNVFGTAGQGPTRVEATPNKRVRIVRDRWGVPHITAKARRDVMYGAGYVSAEDRQLLLEQARGPGRLAILDAPGIDAFGLVSSLRTFVPSAGADAIIARQANLLRRSGPTGRQTLADIDAYVAGINGFYTKSGQIKSGAVKRWTRVDMLAISGFIGSIFGRGGGAEYRNAQFLSALQSKLGATSGRKVFDDLREQNDPDSPASLQAPAPYLQVPAKATGNAPVDDGSFTAAPAAKVTAAERPAPDLMSNALLISAKRSATGHPLFVAGPQIGYYYPELVMEMDLHGGGIDARGIASAGAGPYVFIGRGQDFSWSLTSATNDITDTYVETLCGGSDRRYVFKGKCRPMTVTDAGVLKGQAGGPDQRVRFLETVHGPVLGYATSRGVKVAISRARSTRGREALSLRAFNDLNSNRVTSAQSFLRAIPQLEHTFNVFYADDRDIAMYSSGRLPIRPANVDPSLPARGTGAEEWKGFLPASGHAQQIDPKQGYILNWNNRPAPRFGAADDNWSYGSVHRVEMFDPIKRVPKARLQNVVSTMNGAATQDLRSVELFPVVAAVLAKGSAPSPRDQQVLDILRSWNAHGSSRLDRNLDGTVDDPGAAIWDAWYPKLADAVMNPVLGDLTARFAQLQGRGGSASPGGSSFGGGWYSYIDKDLRTLLGRPVKARFANRYCGKGVVGDCAAALWASLDAAANDLAAAQGPDPAAWRADATRERIKFQPGLIPDTMRWTNRPTYQQVATYGSHRPR
jgi:acyl-homoserine lactone acylase PvdQ